jgi:GNAT superfamily N-acetyltransferase
MGDFRIVPAGSADVPEILRLIRALAEYEKLSHEVVATEEGLREALFGVRPVGEALLAVADGRPVGFAIFFANLSTFLGRAGIYLEDLFVEPEFRGRGIGRGLLHAVAKIAVERHCGRLEWAVLDWNAPAIEFYKRAGAKPMDEWTIFRLTGASLRSFAGGAGGDA